MEAAAPGGGLGLFRDVLEGSFPELYVHADNELHVPAVLMGGGVGSHGDRGEPSSEDTHGKADDGKDEGGSEAGEGEEEGGEGGAGEPVASPDEYQQRIADIETQVRTRTGVSRGVAQTPFPTHRAGARG
jgi:hypothetical protein